MDNEIMQPIEKSIFSYFEAFATECPDRLFLFDEHRRYTVAEAFRASVVLGNRLYNCGIRSGSSVTLRCTRSLDTCLIYLSLQLLGAAVLMTDPHRDVAAFLKESEADADYFITNEAASPDISANGNWTVSGRIPLPIPAPAEAEARIFPAGENLHSPSTIIFTSGSTGKCKGVMLSQYNLVNHIRNFSVSGCYREDDVSAEMLPIHHVFGLAVILMGLIKRYCVLFPETVSIPYAAHCIETYHLTRLDGVPSFALALAEHRRQTGFCSDSLRVGVLGGAPSTKAQFDFIEQELGIKLLPVYGQSECIGITGANETESDRVRSSTVGKFLPMNRGYLLDDRGEEVAPGTEGEICVQGPAVMLGYLGDPEGTKEAIDAEGRLHTGDLGWLDAEGNLHISGRKKDIIIRNGNNISSRKIEEAIQSLPDVAYAAVVGISDPQLGEVPCALVVPNPHHELTPEGLIRQLQPLLAKNELPEQILFRDTLPLTASGKPDKQTIKTLFTT